MVTDFEETHDSKVLGFAVSLENDGVHTVSGNVSVTMRRTWFSGQCYVKIAIAAHENDRKFSIVLVNTVFDAKKLLNGVLSNSFLKSLLKSYLDTFNVQPKFPMVPVNLIVRFMNTKPSFVTAPIHCHQFHAG